MNKTLKSFYDVYRYPDIQKFLDQGKKKSLEVFLKAKTLAEL